MLGQFSNTWSSSRVLVRLENFEDVEYESSVEAEDVCVSLAVSPVAPPPPPSECYEDLLHTQLQIRAFLELNRKAGGNLSGFTPEAYFAEFGYITEEAPWGTHVLDAMLARFQTGRYRYDYQIRDADAFGVGYFLAPLHFSKSKSQEAPVAGDSIWYPTLWFRFGEFVYIVCIAIIVKGSKPWLVHAWRVHNIFANHCVWFD